MSVFPNPLQAQSNQSLFNSQNLDPMTVLALLQKLFQSQGGQAQLNPNNSLSFKNPSGFSLADKISQAGPLSGNPPPYKPGTWSEQSYQDIQNFMNRPDMKNIGQIFMILNLLNSIKQGNIPMQTANFNF